MVKTWSRYTGFIDVGDQVLVPLRRSLGPKLSQPELNTAIRITKEKWENKSMLRLLQGLWQKQRFIQTSKKLIGLIHFFNVRENFLRTTRLKLVKNKNKLITCNWTRTQNHLVRKRTLKHSGQFGQMIECSFTN